MMTGDNAAHQRIPAGVRPGSARGGIEAEIILGDPYRPKATTGAGVEVVAIVKRIFAMRTAAGSWGEQTSTVVEFFVGFCPGFVGIHPSLFPFIRKRRTSNATDGLA
jgi:hypothetical protein